MDDDVPSPALDPASDPPEPPESPEPPEPGTPDQSSRKVWPGEGVIPLREWAAAIRSTGFDGWWDNELYSPLHWESADPFGVAAGLLDVLREILHD